MAEKPSDSPEKPPSETGKTEAAKPIALTPRQSAGSADRVSPLAAAPVAPVALNEQLMSALAQALTGQAAPAPPPVRDERGLMSREEKRFRRGGPGLRSDPAAEKSDSPIADEPKVPPAAAEPEKTPAPVPVEVAKKAEAKKSEPKPEPKPDPFAPAERRQRPERDELSVLRPNAPTFGAVWRRVPVGQRTAIMAVLGIILAMVGFMVGRSTSPVPPPPIGTQGDSRPKPAATENGPARGITRLAEPAEIALIDRAMVAQTNGDFAQTEKLLLQLQQSAPDLPGIQTALAYLSLQKGDGATAQFHIKAGLDAGEDAGRLYGLRGVIQAQVNQPRRAIESMELATRAAPHQFRPFFLLAELLRRGGKNQQALERFDQALARVHERADEDVMQFKRRLTLIAMGRGEELDAEMARRLAENPPSGEWLLLAMAAQAQKGDFKAAAVHLDRVSKLMDTDWMTERLRDFFLYQWCYEKEFEPYFRPLQKRLMALRQKEPPPGAGKEGDESAAPAGSPAATTLPNR